MALTKRTWYAKSPTGQRLKRVAWGFTVQVGARQIRRSDASWTKEDAENAEAQYRLGIGLDQPESQPSKTFGEVAAQYLEVKRGKRSWKDDSRTLDRLLKAFGRDSLITTLTAERISQYQAKRKAELSARRRDRDGNPVPVSPAAVNRELALLRHLLVLAEEWGYIEKVPRIRLEKEPEGRLRFLTSEEIARLLAACEQSKHPELATVVTVALNTGMRKGEVLGLTWDRVDFARGVLLLERTKSGRRREVPMNQAVYDVLSRLTGSRQGRVFQSPTIRTAFERAVEVAKLEDFRFHDLRHTAASYLVMRGASLVDVRAVLGHSDVKMTMRYAHLSPEHLRSAVAKLDGLTSSPVTSTQAMSSEATPTPAVSSHSQHNPGKIEPASRVSA